MEYDNYTAAKQEGFNRVLSGADQLIAHVPVPSSTGELEENEGIVREQLRELVDGVFEISSKLDEAGFKYKTLEAGCTARTTPKSWTRVGTPRACTSQWRMRGMP
jgi:hypothetical protein